MPLEKLIGLIGMLKQGNMLVLGCLSALNLILVIGNIFCYNCSTVISRVILLITYSALLITMVATGFSCTHPIRVKIIQIMLFLSSVFFAIWRSYFFSPRIIETPFGSEIFYLSQQYDYHGHLIFDTPHSYFFLQPLIVHLLCGICGFSSDTSFYISLIIYSIFTALIGIMIYKTLIKYLQVKYRRNLTINIIAPLIAFSIISFAFSERSGLATNLSILLTIIVLYFLATKKFNKRRESVVLLLFMFGIMIGDTNGILLLIPFFFLFAVSARKTYLVYALMPLAYLVFSAYSYTLSLQRYARFAFNGFIEFLQEIISGQLPERTMPWQRVSHRIYEDNVVSSISYLSLFAISLVVILLFLWIRTHRKTIKNHEDAFSKSGVTILFLWLSIAAITYIGASVKPETTFSDIRTIAIVLLSLPLPFILTSGKLISYINFRKVLPYCLTALIVLASLRTVYEIYPKSVNDPIYVVEDLRLGSTRIRVTADFLNTFYKEGGIVGDYKVFNRIGNLLPVSQYEKRLLNETTLTKPFVHFPYKSILIFNVAGIKYPSIYHPPEAYAAAYNFSTTHNRLYDNGIVVISSVEK